MKIKPFGLVDAAVRSLIGVARDDVRSQTHSGQPERTRGTGGSTRRRHSTRIAAVCVALLIHIISNPDHSVPISRRNITQSESGIPLSQPGREMERSLLTAFYPTISVPIPFLMDLCNEPVKLVERTSVAGAGSAC